MSLPEWVKGPEFVAWIDANVRDWRAQLSDAECRATVRMTEHEKAKASLAIVDQICCRLGLHINEIPDDLWTDSPRAANTQWKGRRGAPPEIRQAALRDVANGEPLRAVSKKYQVSVSAIQSWRRRAA